MAVGACVGITEGWVRLAAEGSQSLCGSQWASVLHPQEQLETVLSDPVKKRRYQQQVTVFIVGYQESCRQRHTLLHQLQEVRQRTWGGAGGSMRHPGMDSS